MAKKKTNNTLLAAAALLGGWLLFSSFTKKRSAENNNNDESEYLEYKPLNVIKGYITSKTVYGNTQYINRMFVASTAPYQFYRVQFKIDNFPQWQIDEGAGFFVRLCMTDAVKDRIGNEIAVYNTTEHRTGVPPLTVENSILRAMKVSFADGLLTVDFALNKPEWVTIGVQYNPGPIGWNISTDERWKADIMIQDYSVTLVIDTQIKEYREAKAREAEALKKAEEQAKYEAFYGSDGKEQEIVLQIDPDTFYAQRLDDANSFGNDIETGVSESYFALMYKHKVRPFVIDRTPLDEAANKFGVIGDITNPYYSAKAYLSPHSWKMPIYRFAFVLNITNNSTEAFYIKDIKLTKLFYNGVQLIDFSDDLVFKSAKELSYTGGSGDQFYDTRTRRKRGKLFGYNEFPTSNPKYSNLWKRTAVTTDKDWDYWFNPNAPEAFFNMADYHSNRDVSIAKKTKLESYYKKMFTVDYSKTKDGDDKEFYLPLLREKSNGSLYDDNMLYFEAANTPINPGETLSVPVVIGFPMRGKFCEIGNKNMVVENILQGLAPVYTHGVDYNSIIDRIKSEQAPRFEAACMITTLTGREEQTYPYSFGASSDAHGDTMIKDMEAHNMINYNLTASKAENFYTEKIPNPDGKDFGMYEFVERWKEKRGL